MERVSLRDDSWREKDFSGYDTVFHVAGIAHADVGNVTEERKQEYFRVNRDLTLDVAERARAAGAGQFVFMSSMIVYGSAELVTAETVPKPENFYGDSKWQADAGVRELENTEFHVAVLRPPMIYGKGSKGNYPVLSKLAKRLFVFPKVKNQRSMLYIENLCECLCHIIEEGQSGIFFPQNREWVNTSELVREIAECAGHKLWVTSLLTPFVTIGRHLPGKIGNLCRKAFGTCCYDLKLSEMKWDYRVADLRESVKRTEGEGQEWNL